MTAAQPLTALVTKEINRDGSGFAPAARSRMRVRGETELFPGSRIKLPCLSVGS